MHVPLQNTVGHGYNEHGYNENSLITKENKIPERVPSLFYVQIN